MRDLIIKLSEERLPYMVETRRSFHKYPEVGWLEFRTAAIAAKRMQDLGYTLTMGSDAVSRKDMMGVPSAETMKKAQERAIANGADPQLVARMDGGLTGFWADLQCGGGPGPRFALRFDMDANDVAESSDTSRHRPAREGFASQYDGAMHACGHDAHTAMGLVVAEILASLKDKLKGSIRIIFQPGEEGSRGSGPMVAAGCTKDVDIIFGIHVGAQADKPGVFVSGAQKFLATDKWDVYFTGKAAHAGMAPEKGNNAVLAACAATTNMHAIARHGEGTTRITVGKIEGGQGRNVIPPNAKLVMETRGATTELNDYMATEARRIIEAAAAMWNCTVTIVPVGAAPSGISTPSVADSAAAVAKSLGIYDDIQGIIDFAGTEDFTRMMSDVQARGGIGTYVQIGTTLSAGHHNEFFDIDERCMLDGARICCLMALEYLGT